MFDICLLYTSDNLEHAGSQLPYVLIGAGVSIIGFLILGFVR